MNLIDTWSLISLGGAAQGAVVSAALVVRSVLDRRDAAKNLSLSALVFAGAYTVFVLWLYRTGLIVRIPELIGTQTPVAFVFGPLFYLFMRSWLGMSEPKASDALHLIPFVAYIIYLWPLYALPAEMKTQGVLGAFYSDSQGFRSVQALHMSALVVHLAAYIGAAWRLSRRKQVDAEPVVRYTFLLASLIWALVLIRFMLTLGPAWTSADTIHLIPTTVALALTGLALVSIHPVPDVRLRVRAPSFGVRRNDPGDALTRLRTVMQDEHVYLNADLSLGDLARYVNLRPDELSRLLNETAGESFSDFVNRYRIDRAAELLVDPRYAHLSIAAIGIESGFHSRSTFYRAFRQFKHVAPGEYQKSACPES